jgi:hypothetical protein
MDASTAEITNAAILERRTFTAPLVRLFVVADRRPVLANRREKV